MNKQKRKRIGEAVTLIEQAKDIIEEVSGDEEETFENLPESLQYGERGEAMQTAVDNMQTAVGSLEEAVNSLEEAAE